MQQVAKITQVKCTHSHKQGCIELMMSLGPGPTLQQPRLKGKYASSNGN